MQRRVVTILLLAVTAASVCAQRPGRERGRNRRAPESVVLEHFTWADKSFTSEAIGAEARYGIYLPEGYEDDGQKETRYPLILWLHGMFEDHLRFHTRGGAEQLDKAVEDGALPPCIFVCPDGGRTSMYVNTGQQKWQDLITVDLLAHLEDTYRVAAGREQRAIMGVSMGGMAALRIAFTQPELFCIVATHSAAVFPEDPDDLPDRLKQFANRLGLDEVFGNPIREEAWARANPLCIAKALDPKALRGLRIYFDAGTEDRHQFDQGNTLLDRVLTERGIDHTWRLIPGGGHSWGDDFQGAALPHSFAAVGKAIQMAQARKSALDGLAAPPKGDGKEPAGPGRRNGGR